MTATGFPLIQVWIQLPTSGWQEITQYVRIERDVDIVITAGRADERSQAAPSTCRFQVDNRDGRFSPYNVSGTWYGQIQRGITIKVQANYGSPSDADRFWGELTELPMRWDQSGNDRYATIVASGMSRRLSKGASRSALTHDLIAMGTGSSEIYPYEYWPLEGSASSGTTTTTSAFGSAVGRSSMAIRGTVTPGGYSGFSGAGSIVTLGASGALDGTVRGYTTPASGRHCLRWLSVVPSTAVAATTNLAVMHMDGTVVRWVVEVQTGTLYYKLYGYNAAGTAVVSSSSLIMGGSGQLVWVLQVKQSGTSIDWTLTNNSGIVQSGTLASNTTGSIRSVQFAPGGDLTGASIGHVHVSSDIYTSTLWNAALDYGYGSGFSQEKADTRVKRLCAALGTPITLTCPQVNSTDAGEPMGWPPSGTFWSRLADCATADGGLLADSPFDKALEFYTQRYLYTTSVAMTLDTATGHIASPPELTLDDQKLVTDATITRQGGSSARYATSSTEGEYTSSQTLNIGTDPRALPAAEWAVAVGTNTDARIPKLTVNLRRNTSLIASWFLTRFGQRLRVTTPPSDVGPGEKGTNSAAGYDYMIQGWTEYLGYYDWRVDFNLTPARPWTVGYLGASASRVLENQGGLAVNTPGYNTTATSIQVIGAGTDTMPLLSTTSADYPRSVLAATGEEMTVTAVSGSSWPQTLTVTRSVNGVVKTLPTATRIYLTQPFRWSK